MKGEIDMMKLSKEDIVNISDYLREIHAQYHIIDDEKAEKAWEYSMTLLHMSQVMCHDDEIQIDDCVEYVHG